MFGRTHKSHLLTAAAIVVAATVLAIGLEHLGRTSRRVRAAAPALAGTVEVVLARNGAEVLRAWRERGFTGRTVMHVGRFLHFVEPSGADHLQAELLTGPGQGPVLVEAFARQANDENYLWTAAETGVARRLLYVSPEGSLRLRAAELEEPFDGSLDLELNGFTREATVTVPPVAEPVLLDVAASYFDEGSGEALFHMLEEAGIRADLVTLSLLEGSDGVTESARNRLRAFALALGRGRR